MICRTLAFLLMFSVTTIGQIPPEYKGKPYGGTAQTIPGRLKLIQFDTGGEGVAYHDSDPDVNNGTKCCGNTFRSDEGVDINGFHTHDHTLAGPLDLSDHYVGWLEVGEWLNYTVQVKRAGTYRVAAHASCAAPDCEFRLFVKDKDVSGPLSPASTGAVHTWNVYLDLGKARLKAGRQVLTIKITKLPRKGTMNLDYLDFVSEEQAR